MIFSTFQFLAFFISLIIILSVAKTSYRKLILLIASYYFYACWDYRFIALIFIITVSNFIAGKALFHSQDRAYRKILLIITVIFNLSILGCFKYYNFFIDSANIILSTWGLNASTLNIILPVGISFYTFQALSYTIDIYRGDLESVDSFSDFALFVSFFPQLVAGPIVRASDFLPQLKKPVEINRSNIWSGSQIFIIGLFKKLMIADAVAPFVDHVFENPDYFSSPTVWLAVIAYTIQIYCDFSGYSDMAIGCARILGFRFHQNFNMPYLSRDIGEFWRRWHISLSTWLRDYLYISLGGNRKGEQRTYINFMITMLLGGLWHGASWNFIAWGGLHGLALVVHRFWHRHIRFSLGYFSPLITFIFVIMAWVLFRSQTTQVSINIYRKLCFINPAGAEWYYRAAIAAIGWTFIGYTVGILRKNTELVFFDTPYSYRSAVAVITTILLIYVFSPTNVSPFIYFQF